MHGHGEGNAVKHAGRVAGRRDVLCELNRGSYGAPTEARGVPRETSGGT
nr:MAG TPA: hypothetical protein [Caudoviricetes sp.]